MTSSKISQMAALMRASELTGAQKNPQQENGPVFGALLSQTSGGKKDANAWNGNVIQPPKAGWNNQEAFVKETAGSSFKENPISSSNAGDIQSKLPEDTQEKLEAFEEKVTETVAEELGVTEEEVREAMEAMGMTVMDLTDPSKLADLVMELTGSEDIGSLLLSEDFQQIFGEIRELTQDLAAELELSPEELPQFMEQLETMLTANSEELPEELQEQSLQPELEAEVTETAEKTAGNSGEALQNTPAEAAAFDQKVREAAGQEHAMEAAAEEETEPEQEQQIQKADVQDQTGSEEYRQEGSSEKSLSETAQGSKTAEKSESPQHHVTYQTTAQTVNQGQALEVTQTVVQTRIDVEDIMRQVSQMTRVMVSQAESSIEMQLNPANLGKVYLQVVSREGVITAQLAAQNEAVKEALESQVAILKENMNQQGMKVEAIEVTIASHEFERNLEQNQQNMPGEQQETDSQKSSRRNINLNHPEELEGEFSEEENLAAKIMAEQGNSMDLTA
ncbi:MAG: hypothetical protein HFH49_01825 [Lachnospiraceae bacterium]|nr:hypothetical protein [Lachnospiraceae bacterium]